MCKRQVMTAVKSIKTRTKYTLVGSDYSQQE